MHKNRIKKNPLIPSVVEFLDDLLESHLDDEEAECDCRDTAIELRDRLKQLIKDLDIRRT